MAAGEPISVLLVEDDAAEAQLVLDVLAFSRRQEFVVRHARRLEDAIDDLGARPTDVVVLDLGLPDAQGLDGLRRMRLAAPGMAIVVRSGLDDDRLALEALEAGAQDYIVKRSVGVADMLERSIRYALARRQAEDANRRLAALIDSSPDAIISTDLDGSIVSFNPGAERMFGYSPGELLGQPIARLSPPDLHDEIGSFSSERSAGRSPASRRAVCVATASRSRWR